MGRHRFLVTALLFISGCAERVVDVEAMSEHGWKIDEFKLETQVLKSRDLVFDWSNSVETLVRESRGAGVIKGVRLKPGVSVLVDAEGFQTLQLRYDGRTLVAWTRVLPFRETFTDNTHPQAQERKS